MNINHLSVSRKKCYDHCQQQYKYKYHLKVPVDVTPIYLDYGKAVHKASELYVESRGEIPITQLAKHILDKKIAIEGEDKATELFLEYKGSIPIEKIIQDLLDKESEKSEEEKKKVEYCIDLPPDYLRKYEKHIKSIEKFTKQTGFDGIAEYAFEYDLDPPNGKKIIGFIDRLIIRGEGDNRKAFIIDYKTTKKSNYRTNKNTVKHDLQLMCYSRVVSRDFGIPAKNIRAALFFLEGEEVVDATYSEEELDMMEKELKDGYYSIENADPDKVWGNVTHLCNWCDYKNLCPFFNKKSTPHWSGDLKEIGVDDSKDAWDVDSL